MIGGDIMTNIDAISYAQVAILNLKNRNVDINHNTMMSEMYYLFDLYSEIFIHDEFLRITDYDFWMEKHKISK